ncbi:hypothetical protein BDQ12DRAFT_351912 [Crucibulum laeve]|uniref:Uncharacterized protein n=1 Tax=Crucibulum laeve TaxID=68775 RepID=A0A5C3MDY3_9AGAR|nr:hypothetical protein BDQ12DRAFT_351912 [Crucibulum laeve]
MKLLSPILISRSGLPSKLAFEVSYIDYQRQQLDLRYKQNPSQLLDEGYFDHPLCKIVAKMRTRPTNPITARRFVVTSFFALFSCVLSGSSQVRVLFTEHNYPWAPYFPNKIFVWIFAAFQIMLQAIWLGTMFRIDPTGDSTSPRVRRRRGESISPIEEQGLMDDPELELGDMREELLEPEPSQFAYVPYYIVANIWMGAWSVTWLSGRHIIAQFFLSLNAATHIFGLFWVLYAKRKHSLCRENFLTHLVAKTSCGLAVLYMWKNWGSIDDITPPSTPETVQTGVIFVLLTICSGPDPTLGIALLYDLLALMIGQPEYAKHQSAKWHRAFIYIFICVALAMVGDLIWCAGWVRGEMQRGISMLRRGGPVLSSGSGSAISSALTEVPIHGHAMRPSSDVEPEEVSMLPLSLKGDATRMGHGYEIDRGRSAGAVSGSDNDVIGFAGRLGQAEEW